MNQSQAQAPAFHESDLKNISDMISSFVGNNKVAVSELPNTLSHIINTYNNIRLTGVSINEADSAVSATAVTDEPRTPVVPVNKSVKQDYIICLLDGGRFKSLKKHLKTKYNLTPQQYREMFGLKADYPMVAPSYSLARSALAKASGLGRTTHERLGKNSGRKVAASATTKRTTKAASPVQAKTTSAKTTAKAAPATKRGKKAA
jgi:predicted transcriptional regulator